MKIVNEMKISFKSKSENEGFARTAVCAFAAFLDPGIEDITNCIVHAYRGTEGIIEITARILNDNEIYIRIKDKGCGIPDVKRAMEPLYTTAPCEERAGLGFAVMESFMDKLTVKSTVGKGTVVTMRKKLGAANE